METINSAVMIYIFSKNSTERKQMANSITARPRKRNVTIIIVDFRVQILDCV